MKDHDSGCPRLQFWDAGENEAPCLCGEKPMSQVEKLSAALEDGRPHRSDELVAAVYGSAHLGLARLAARIHDLKARLPQGQTINSWRDREIETLWWYQIVTLDVPVQQGKLL